MSKAKVNQEDTSPWDGVPGSMTAKYILIETKHQSGDILCLKNFLKINLQRELFFW